MTRIVSCACLLFALWCSTFALNGCASSGGSRAEGPTGGVDLTLSVRDETGAEEYYEVDRKGNLGWGGGVAARLTKVTWNDQLTADELTQLKQLLADANWFSERPQSTNEPPNFRYRMSINAPQSRRTFTLTGDHPHVAPIRQLLATAALRRLQPDLDKLPQPSRSLEERQ